MLLPLELLLVAVAVWQAARHVRSAAGERSKRAVVGVTAAAALLLRLPVGAYPPAVALLAVALYVEIRRAIADPADPSQRTQE